MGLSFLTPLASLLVLAAALPIAALLVAERRSQRIRSLLRLHGARRRTVVSAAVALAVLLGLVAVAAAQPIVVRERVLSQRGDAQAFFVFDTSKSMSASAGRGLPTRLARAKRLAVQLRAAVPDVPVGIASMTDRTLPNLMPTTDAALFQRTLAQSVAIDAPPPSQRYRGRATTFQALLPVIEAHFFPSTVRRRLVVVFTDGESAAIPPILRATLRRAPGVFPFYVHVWAGDERIYLPGGRVDPRYRPDPTSTDALRQFASLTGGRFYTEQDARTLGPALRAAAGSGGVRTSVDAYARVALAPWFVLGGVAPLGFLLYKRNL